MPQGLRMTLAIPHRKAPSHCSAPLESIAEKIASSIVRG